MKNNRYEAWVMTKRRLIAVSPVALLYFIYIFLKDFGKWERVITETAALLVCTAVIAFGCFLIWGITETAALLVCTAVIAFGCFLICYVIVKKKSDRLR